MESVRLSSRQVINKDRSISDENKLAVSQALSFYKLPSVGDYIFCILLLHLLFKSSVIFGEVQPVCLE